MWKELLFRLITVLLLVGLVGSMLYVGFYFYTVRQSDTLSARLSQQRSIAINGLSSENTSTPSHMPTYDASAAPTASLKPMTTEAPTVSPDPTASSEAPDESVDDPLLSYYNTLAKENPDMIGWISIADTPVDYPVMYTPQDPQYYLNRDFDRKYTVEGMPFLDERCDADAPSDNLIIYGHNMRSGQMFGSLSSYREEEYRQTHSLVSFDTLKERRTYRIYAGFVVRLAESLDDTDMLCYRVDLTSNEERLQALLDYASLHALFADPEIEPKIHDQLLTLSTCTSVRKSERFVLMAVRIE